MTKTVRRVICGVLLLTSLALLIFCPIFSMRVELNDGVTKSICYVSIFTALFRSTITIGNVVFNIKVTDWAIILIAVLQIIGLALTYMKKGYAVGLILIAISWVLFLALSLIVINVQSDLFAQYGAVQQQSVSGLVALTILSEMILAVFNDLIQFEKI